AAEEVRRASGRTKTPRWPAPVDRKGGPRQRSAPSGLAHGHDQDAFEAGSPTGLSAPDLRDLALRRDLVGRDAGQAIALRCRGSFPDEAAQIVPAAQPLAAILL